MRLELAVSHELLHEPFDQWQPSNEALGVQYPVVLRSRDRMRAMDGTPAKTKWIRRHEQGSAEQYCWHHKTRAGGRISDDQPHIVVYQQPICSDQDASHTELVGFLEQGIAFAVWSRGGLLKQSNLKCIKQCKAGALPDAVFDQIRKQPKHPHQKSLALLHDCYDRNPIDAEPFQLGANR